MTDLPACPACPVPDSLPSPAPTAPAPAPCAIGLMQLKRARAHEFCGPARQTLALMVAAAEAGPVIWIAPAAQPARLNPDGIRALTGPERFLFIRPERRQDLLWSGEEVLRSGSVGLCVIELPGPPGLVAVRRLHLAAETGAEAGFEAPLALLLTPGDGGAPGIESRWHLAARHRPDRPGWRLERRRARAAPQASWLVTRDGARWPATPDALTPP